jgi:hypothetical protein
VSTLVDGGGEGRAGGATGGCDIGNLGTFGSGVNVNVPGLNTGAALRGLPNEVPRAWPNARGN